MHNLFSGKPVLVFGSAPNPIIPKEFNGEWKIICMNASGLAVKRGNLPHPDITIFSVSGLLRSASNYVEIRKNIKGLYSENVLIRMLSGSFLKHWLKMWRSKRVLRSLDYSYHNINCLGPAEWRAILLDVLGTEHMYLSKNISTGVFCVILALYLNSGKVVVSGINPDSTGHSYSSSNIWRQHSDSDKDTLLFLENNHNVELLA